MSAGSQLAPLAADTTLKGRTPLAHLLHALNQPLTGLQCSMELAVAGPRPSEQYVRVLREGLDLAARMRMLVEAIRELVDIEQSEPGKAEAVPLDALLGEAIEGLRPVAETRAISLAAEFDRDLAVEADRRGLEAALFRLLDSALGLARQASPFRITATRAPAGVVLAVSWADGPAPEHSPFSRAELGILIAQASWERAGADWSLRPTGAGQTCTISLPLTGPPIPAKLDHHERDQRERSK